MAAKHSAEVLLSVPKCRTAVWRDYVYVRQAVLRHELVTNSMLTNQHYTSNKVSLKRNTHKTRLYIDQLKICDERLTVI